MSSQNDKTEFADKVVVITGSSSGIGEVTAKRFAERSASLVVIGRNVPNLNRVAKECEKLGAKKVLAIAADISIDSELERIVKETIDTYGKIDVLVNNAAIVIPGGIFGGIEGYDKMMNTNMRAVYLLTHLAVPHLIKTKGNIIQVSSVAGSKPLPILVNYCITKAAMNMFTRAVALELAPHGVRVNALTPGGTLTPINQEVRDRLAKAGKKPPTAVFGRISEPDEMADMIVYMAGWKARGMTGSNVFIDNGMMLADHIKEP